MSGAAFSAGDPLLRQSVGRRAIRPTMSCVTKAGPASSPFSKNTAIRCRSLRSRSNAANVARQHRSLRCPARSPIRVMRITGGRSACGRRTGIPNCCCCRDRSATMVVRGACKALQKGSLQLPGQYLAVRPGTVIEKEFRLAIDPEPLRGAAFRRPVHRALELYAPFSCEGLPGFEEIVAAKCLMTRSRWDRRGSGRWIQHVSRAAAGDRDGVVRTSRPRRVISSNISVRSGSIRSVCMRWCSGRSIS